MKYAAPVVLRYPDGKEETHFVQFEGLSQEELTLSLAGKVARLREDNPRATKDTVGPVYEDRSELVPGAVNLSGNVPTGSGSC